MSLEYLRSLHTLGVNRLSLGMQTASPEELRLLEREHDFRAVIEAVSWSRRAGIDNLNLDLIFGLPYQALSSWQRSLELAIGLCPEHLSLYSLTLEHGTPLGRWAERGLISEPDSDNAAEKYEWSMDYLDQNGYEQYEISNWARGDRGKKIKECRHNLQYWYNQPYLGIGAGAHGFAGGLRIANVRGLNEYITRLYNDQLSLSQTSDKFSGSTVGQWIENVGNFAVTPATCEVIHIDQKLEMDETMLMGLRLTQEGVGGDVFNTRFGTKYNEIYNDPH